MDNELANLEYDGVNEEDINAVKNGEAEPAGFPFIVFSAAVVKDIVDIASLGMVGVLMNIVFVPILYIYLRKEARYMKNLKKWVARRVVATLGAELVPIVNMVPWWTIFVYKVYKKRKGQTERIQNFIESFAK